MVRVLSLDPRISKQNTRGFEVNFLKLLEIVFLGRNCSWTYQSGSI